MIFQNLALCDFRIGCADAYRTAEAQQAARRMVSWRPLPDATADVWIRARLRK